MNSQEYPAAHPRKYRWLLVIIVASVILRLITAFLLGNRILLLPGIADQIHYHTLATRILAGYGFTFNMDWWPMTKAGAPTAHWSYLYTFFITVIYFFFGEHPLTVRIIQSVIAGSLLPWLVFRITLKVFTPNPSSAQKSGGPDPKKFNRRFDPFTIGLIAASWAGIYGYFIYYAAALMTESFYILGILWVFDCSLEIVNKHKINIIDWVVLGFALWITVLLRQVFLLFIPFLLLWILLVLLHQREKFAQTRNKVNNFWKILAGEGITVAFLIILILPFTIFNYQRFHRFVLLNTNSGFAFYWSNHPIYGTHFIPILPKDKGTYQDLIPMDLRNLDEAALDQALLKRGLQIVLEDPIRYTLLSISRIPYYFMFLPSSSSSTISNITRVFSFGIALPFMIAGILLWLLLKKYLSYDWAAGLLLILFMLVYSGIHILSWSLIRYRLPVDAIGLIFTSFALYLLINWGRTRIKS